MKILVFSDSHHSLGNMYEAAEKEKPDQILHLGDHYEDAEDLRAAFPRTAIQYVPGNCDYACDLPTERLLIFQNIRIFMTHGHKYFVKSDLSRLIAAAKAQNADVVLFGHTHIPYLENTENMTVMNPASCGRGTGKPGYGRIVIENGSYTCKLIPIEE